MKKSNIDKEALKHWKKISPRAKLDWLESVLRMTKLRKF